MTATPAPGAISTPMVTVHALGLAVGKLSDTAAQLVLHNPVVHATASLNRAALVQLGQQFLALAEQLVDEAPQLITPQGAGQLIVPGTDR